MQLWQFWFLKLKRSQTTILSLSIFCHTFAQFEVKIVAKNLQIFPRYNTKYQPQFSEPFVKEKTNGAQKNIFAHISTYVCYIIHSELKYAKKGAI